MGQTVLLNSIRMTPPVFSFVGRMGICPFLLTVAAYLSIYWIGTFFLAVIFSAVMALAL
ncbi:MAG: hypothetical protein ACRD18_09150 [Terriglobia bacterium]